MVIESPEFNTSDLLDHLKSKMSAYMIPREIKFMDKFPLNTNGKTDRKILTKKFEV